MVVLTAPLPTDKAECRAVLDAACLALWGGTEWERVQRRRRQMPEAWLASMFSCSDEKEWKARAADLVASVASGPLKSAGQRCTTAIRATARKRSHCATRRVLTGFGL